jgi:flagellar hook-associated protein 3 FlgL
MLGRITPAMSSATILADINTDQNQMATTEEQLSSGKSINQPSDNPFGASQAVALNSDLANLTTYTNNVTDGTAWSQAAGSAVTNITQMVQRVQELVVQASNGTQSASDLSDDAAEVNQLTDAIKQEANTQYDGQYIFSGTATSTAPYTTATGDAFQGNTAAVSRTIGPGSSVQVNADLSGLLNGTGGAATGGLIGTLRTISSDMTSDNQTDLSSQLTTLQSGLDSLTQTSTTIGATQDQLQLAQTRITSLQNSDTTELSNDEDANMATTMTTYSNEQAAYTAALRAGADIVQQSLMDFLST